MNYRNIAISELNQTTKDLPDYSVGQIILSILKLRDNKDISIEQWLFEVSDEDFFTAIEKAGQVEKPEVEFFNKD